MIERPGNSIISCLASMLRGTNATGLVKSDKDQGYVFLDRVSNAFVKHILSFYAKHVCVDFW